MNSRSASGPLSKELAAELRHYSWFLILYGELLHALVNEGKLEEVPAYVRDAFLNFRNVCIKMGSGLNGVAHSPLGLEDSWIASMWDTDEEFFDLHKACDYSIERWWTEIRDELSSR